MANLRTLLWWFIVLRLSDKVDNLLQSFILDFAITLESLTALHMTAHLANKIRVVYLEIGIADKGTTCKMAGGDFIDGSDFVLSCLGVSHLDIAGNSGHRENNLDGIVVLLSCDEGEETAFCIGSPVFLYERKGFRVEWYTGLHSILSVLCLVWGIDQYPVVDMTLGELQ